MGCLYEDMDVKTYSKDNLKELNKDINSKLYSLLNKVSRTNISAPCLLQFMVNYSTLEVGIIITHRKQDNRIKDIPRAIKLNYGVPIPKEDEEYFYSTDPKKGYLNTLISPNFVFSTLDFDIAKGIRNNVFSHGFLIFPRSLYKNMKENEKMLFEHLSFSIKNDNLSVSYKLFNKENKNDYKLYSITDELEKLLEIKVCPFEVSRYPEEMKNVIRNFSEYKKDIIITKEKLAEDLVLKLNYEGDEVLIFKDFILGSTGKIGVYQSTDDYGESSKMCTVMLCVNYNGWHAYYYYKYMKFEGIDY